MATILLVDDDPALVEILAEYLRRFSHEVSGVTRGDACMEIIASAEPDIVILDVNMPGTDGWETLRQIRRMSNVPVIMLTAATEETDVLKGFATGADDYVGKPFSFAQLEARVRAVLARTEGRSVPTPRVITHGDLAVDVDAHRVFRRGEQVKLTPTEFRLLLILMENPNKVLSSDTLVRRVWGEEYASDSDYVRRYIWYLRQKLEPNPDEPTYIRNERNIGYFFAVS
ncbi:MAG: response regulator transcription factor [Chloroflexi bacterium]|nr:response regulator transcription factor [Chloroflexota bacterium]